MSPSRIQLYGLPCSGTNYLGALIEKNILGVTICDEFGFKHRAPENLDRQNLDQRGGDIAFCLIVRHPYDWIRSLHRNPWHVAHELRGLSLCEFMTRTWWCIWDEQSDVAADDPRFGSEMMHERHPETGDRYANVLRMRSDRLSRWLDLKRLGRHFWWVQYESLRRYPRRLIGDLASRLGRPLGEHWTEIDHYKDRPHEGIYQPLSYPPLTEPERGQLHGFLDWDLESQLGYFPSHRSEFPAQ